MVTWEAAAKKTGARMAARRGGGEGAGNDRSRGQGAIGRGHSGGDGGGGQSGGEGGGGDKVLRVVVRAAAAGGAGATRAKEARAAAAMSRWWLGGEGDGRVGGTGEGEAAARMAAR